MPISVIFLTRNLGPVVSAGSSSSFITGGFSIFGVSSSSAFSLTFLFTSLVAESMFA